MNPILVMWWWMNNTFLTNIWCMVQFCRRVTQFLKNGCRNFWHFSSPLSRGLPSREKREGGVNVAHVKSWSWGIIDAVIIATQGGLGGRSLSRRGIGTTFCLKRRQSQGCANAQKKSKAPRFLASFARWSKCELHCHRIGILGWSQGRARHQTEGSSSSGKLRNRVF